MNLEGFSRFHEADGPVEMFFGCRLSFEDMVPLVSGGEELISLIQKAFRLTRYEASLYVALLKGASNPKEASSLSGVPLPRIYDVIRVLESKGFVVSSESWYRPLPPRAVAVAEIARVEGEARSRIRQIMHAAEALESIAGEYAGESEVVNVESLYSAISLVAETISKSAVLIISFFQALTGFVDRFKPLIREASGLGVEVIVAGDVEVDGDNLNIKRVENVAIASDMIATELIVVYVVPDRKSGDVKGIAIRDRGYASKVVKAFKESLKS